MNARSMYINTRQPLLSPTTTTKAMSSNNILPALTAEEHRLLADHHFEIAQKNTLNDRKYKMHVKRYHAHKASEHMLSAEMVEMPTEQELF
jgi:hypothetical protein